MNNESVIVQLGVKRESLVVKLEQWCEREGIPFANVMRLADDPASTAISLARKVRMVEAEIDEAQAAGRKDDNEKETSPIQKTDCQFELPSAAMYRLKEKLAEDMMNECVYARLEECSFSTDEHEYTVACTGTCVTWGTNTCRTVSERRFVCRWKQRSIRSSKSGAHNSRKCRVDPVNSD